MNIMREVDEAVKLCEDRSSLLFDPDLSSLFDEQHYWACKLESAVREYKQCSRSGEIGDFHALRAIMVASRLELENIHHNIGKRIQEFGEKKEPAQPVDFKRKLKIVSPNR